MNIYTGTSNGRRQNSSMWYHGLGATAACAADHGIFCWVFCGVLCCVLLGILLGILLGVLWCVFLCILLCILSCILSVSFDAMYICQCSTYVNVIVVM